MKCVDCGKKITILEWFNSSLHGLIKKRCCNKCKSKRIKKWVNQQSKLIMEGRKELPKVC